MQFNDLDGRKLKNDVPSLETSDKVHRDYHNKHVDGSGNFGMQVKVEIPEGEREEGPLGREREYEFIAKVNGTYDEEQAVTSLQIGDNPAGGGASIDPTYEALVQAINDAVQDRSDYR